MNKSDPFGEMSSREESATGDEPVVAEPKAREEEPVEADHVGALLCATRMRAGGDLQEIAKVLRIRYGYLVAIEDGRHEDLPGSAYSIGFIRAYADYLGLDGNEVVRRLREETNGTVTTARFKFPAPSGESGLPNGGLLAIAVVMGMVVYGSWYTITNSGRDAVDLIQEVPDRLAALIDGQDQGSVAEQAVVQSNISLQSRADDSTVASNEANNQTTSSDVIVAASEDSVVVEGPDEVEITDEPIGGINATEMVETTQANMASTDTADVSSTELPSGEIASANEQAEFSAESQEAEDSGVQETLQISGSTELVKPVSADELSEVVDSSIASEETSQPASIEPVETESVQPTLAAAPSVAEPNESSSRGASGDLGAVEDTAAAIKPASTPTGASVVEPDMSSTDATEASTPRSEVEAAASTEPAIIELRAKSDSWIQVRDGDELLLTRLLRKGEVYRVPDRDGLTLMTGNAGGLEVFVGGEQVPPLGDKGVVRRGVPLNAERLKSGVAPG